MNLLIVDDEMHIIQGILNGVQWENLGLKEILTAKSYEQAIQIFQEKEVHILIADIEMSDHNGLELIQWVNMHFPETECMILSCHDDFQYARRAVSLKCRNYLLKPVPYEILEREINDAIQTQHLKFSNKKMEEYANTYLKHLEVMGEDQERDVLTKSVAYVKEHVLDDISVELLAKYVHISPRQLVRIFKKEFHQTVNDYIVTQKMIIAGQLLLTTKMSVTMISDKVGYGNYSYFIKLFKKYYGITPREYQLGKGKK